jgi:ABC-2 type transport system permease protein
MDPYPGGFDSSRVIAKFLTMRLLTIFIKTCREMSRDLWVLGLTLAFAPLFVYLYWVFTQGGSTSYTILVANQDLGVPLQSGITVTAGQEAIQAIENVRYANENPLLKVKRIDDRTKIDSILKNRGAAAFILIPEDFSQALMALREGDRSIEIQIIFGGDLSNPYYTVGATLALGAIDNYVIRTTGQQPLIRYTEQPMGASAARTEFEIYVPGILIFSEMMLIFLAAMTVAREIESGALKRLQISPMTSFDLLGGITAAMMLVGVAAVVLTVITAYLLGFRSQGPMWITILIGAVTSLSIFGAGLVVACFSRTVSQAFVVANFPLGLFMFFSGAIFPIPKVALFTLAGHEFGLNDILPPTHAVVALNKVMVLGAGIKDVIFELTALLVLSLLYFFVGVWLFKRLHLK